MLMVIGASHHDLDLHQLEALTAHTGPLRSGLRRLITDPAAPIGGAVTLSTCNRLEIYLDAALFHDAVDAVTSLIAEATGLPQGDIADLVRVRVGAPVAAHLFSVTTGLDSMVVGEAEISGQVASAHREAQQDGSVTPVLHTLFQSALRTAKQVVSTTSLGGAGRSVVTVALDLAEPARGAAVGSALIIGTGAYARVTVAALRARGVADLHVFSPSGRAAGFAERHHTRAVTVAELAETLAKVDLVVSCSGQSGSVIDGPTVAQALLLRDSPVRIVDLALPSDIPDAVRDLAGVQVVDLRTVAAQAAPEHREALTAAQDLVIAAVSRFEDEQVTRMLDPAVTALRGHVSATVTKELARLRSKYDADIAADLELTLHRVTQALLHTPTLRAKELARTGDSAHYLQALHTLFGIELAAGNSPGADHA